MPKHNHQIIVGNVGTVYQGTSQKNAYETYQEYVEQSKSKLGRAGDEEVTWMRDDDIYLEYHPVTPYLMTWAEVARMIQEDMTPAERQKVARFCLPLDESAPDPANPACRYYGRQIWAKNTSLNPKEGPIMQLVETDTF